ncbi:MAG TPA: hypothetical protein VEI57_18790 [Nitrospirota bacterium]|nr:hypothetical protein [Nitrospirota bacterium]
MLDWKTVPRYFVAFIVNHEMLHVSMGSPLIGMQRILHSREFKRQDTLFPRYKYAIAWAASFNFTIAHLSMDDRGKNRESLQVVGRAIE